MTTDVISPADVQAQANETTREVLAFVSRHAIAVTDQATLVEAGEIRGMIGQRQKSIVAQIAKPKSWAHGLHAWFCSLERAMLAPLNELDARLCREIQTYNTAETRRREERERALAAARYEAEQQRAASEAAALERAGERALAAAVIEEAVAAPPPVVRLPDTVREVQRFRRDWKFQIVDAAAVPREFCEPDERKLGKFASAMQGTGAVPGVRFYYVDTPVR